MMYENVIFVGTAYMPSAVFKHILQYSDTFCLDQLFYMEGVVSKQGIETYFKITQL